MFLIIFPLAIIYHTICIYVFASTLLDIIFKFTFVFVAIVEIICTEAISTIFYEIALIFLAICVILNTISIFLIIFIQTFMMVTKDICWWSFTTSFTFYPLALIYSINYWFIYAKTMIIVIISFSIIIITILKLNSYFIPQSNQTFTKRTILVWIGTVIRIWRAILI
jgi:hypothetical protein